MAYTTSVSVFDTEGGTSSTLDITARIWMLWFVAGAGSGTGNQQMEQGLAQGLVGKDLSSPLAASFPGTTNFSGASRSVGISVQDSNRVANDTGWLFRSGEFPADLPAAMIEIVTASRTFTSAELAGMLPALPITADAGTTTLITAVTMTPVGDGLDLVVTGSTMATGALMTMTVTAHLALLPATDVQRPETAITVGLVNPAVTFGPGPAAGNAIIATVLNAVSAGILRDIAPALRVIIERMLNTEIARGVGRAFPGGTLPAGVVLSMRSIRATNAGALEVRGALGAYGGVINKLPPITIGGGGGSGRPCFVATAALGADAPEVVLLRAFRDDVLRATQAGRAFVRLYERVSPPLAARIASRPAARRLARVLVVQPAARLAGALLGRDRRRPG